MRTRRCAQPSEPPPMPRVVFHADCEARISDAVSSDQATWTQPGSRPPAIIRPSAFGERDPRPSATGGASRLTGKPAQGMHDAMSGKPRPNYCVEEDMRAKETGDLVCWKNQDDVICSVANYAYPRSHRAGSCLLRTGNVRLPPIADI